MNSIKRILKDLGLSPKEADVLMVLLQHSSLFAAQISSIAKLNRTTTYGILKNLIEKGLVSSVKKGKTVKFQSISPELLPSYIERKQEVLNETKIQINELLPQLRLIKNKNISLPKIQFFEGEDGVKQAYEDTLENNNGKVLYDFTGTDAVFKRMGKEWVQYYVKKRTRLGIKCFDIAPDSEWSRNSKESDEKFARITKLIPACYTFNTEIDIYDNKVAIFSFSEKNPIAVIIEDENIAHTMKTLYRYVDSLI